MSLPAGADKAASAARFASLSKDASDHPHWHAAMPATLAETIFVDDREVIVTNAGKVLFPQGGYTKLDVVRYYLSVAEGALRGAGDRPNILVRYPDGIDAEFFFQKRAPKERPSWVEVVTIRFPSGRTAEEVVPRHAADLAFAVDDDGSSRAPADARRMTVESRVLQPDLVWHVRRFQVQRSRLQHREALIVDRPFDLDGEAEHVFSFPHHVGEL